jgi:imidazolonepropionase
MKFAVSLACIKMRLQPEEAINAATINGAAAMGLSDHYGSIAKGMVANFFITEPIPSVAFMPYAYTTPVINRVFLAGKEVKNV